MLRVLGIVWRGVEEEMGIAADGGGFWVAIGIEVVNTRV